MMRTTEPRDTISGAWHREVPLLLMTRVGAWTAAAADTEAMKKLRASIELCDVEETRGSVVD